MGATAYKPRGCSAARQPGTAVAAASIAEINLQCQVPAKAAPEAPILDITTPKVLKSIKKYANQHEASSSVMSNAARYCGYRVVGSERRKMSQNDVEVIAPVAAELVFVPEDVDRAQASDCKQQSAWSRNRAPR